MDTLVIMLGQMGAHAGLLFERIEGKVPTMTRGAVHNPAKSGGGHASGRFHDW